MAPSTKTGYYEDGRYTMYNYRNFADVFDFDLGGCYNRKQTSVIEGNRQRLRGLLMDKVLKQFVGVKEPRSIYPPKTRSDIQHLHEEIVQAESADHAKLSAFYYILLDCSDSQNDKRQGLLEDEIIKKFYLPRSHEVFMKGLWYMDRGDFHTALQYLTHPSLVPTLEDDILAKLVTFTNAEDLSLPLAYYHTVQPSLKTPKAIKNLFVAIVTSSVTQAFYFSRSQPENLHKQLFETLIAEVFEGYQDPEKIGERSVELVNLPFTVEEEEWFEEFLTKGEGRKLQGAADTVMMRRIGTGRFEEALKVHGRNSQTLDGMSWDHIVNTMENGLRPRMKDGNVFEG